LGLARVTIGENVAYTAQFEQWIPLPVAQVFEFFGNPKNLPRIMPGWMHLRVDQMSIVPPPDAPRDRKLAGTGSLVTVSFRPIPFLPFRLRTRADIIGFAMNQFFEDTHAHSDPLFKNWHHRHEFAAENRAGVPGTIVRDVVTYELAFGPLSPVVNALFVAGQMRRTFEFRQRVVERFLPRL